MPERLNSSYVKGLPLRNKIYYDDDLRGFAVRVTDKGSKTYLFQARVNGRVIRSIIGAHTKLTAEEARKRAKKLAAQMADGVDPNVVKRQERARAVTLKQVLTDYIADRKLRETTAKDYGDVITRCLPDWLDKPITYITRERVNTRHKQQSSLNTKRGSGQAQADKCMRVLRALLEFANDHYRDADDKPIIPENPVKRALKKKWNNVGRRQRIVSNTDLPKWYQHVLTLTADNNLMRDYLLLCLFTGLRRNEAAKLRWSDVDFTEKTLTVPAPIAKNAQEHRLPLPDYVFNLLQTRKNLLEAAGKLGEYVFPGDGKTGHLIESKNSIAKITKETKIEFSPHDLRRTFLTTAESLDIPHYALKKLANHKVPTSDVTGGYLVVQVERLREPMRMISESLEKACNNAKVK